MHSTLVRAQNVFGFFTTVCFTVAAIIAISVAVLPQTPTASLQLKNVQVVRGRPHYYSSQKEEYAHVKFDLDTDLSTLFNWNTKQVFLYITATYPSHKAGEPDTKAIVWDAILPSTSAPWHHNHFIHPVRGSSSSSNRNKNNKKSKSTKAVSKEPLTPGILHLQNQRPKYQISDPSQRLANRTDAVLELEWNIQPWVGALTWTNKVDWGFWKGLEGGKSEVFKFPGLKGAKGADLKTEKGGEGNRGKPA